MNLPDAPIAHVGFFATHFLVQEPQLIWQAINKKTFEAS
jgi:hypothetical protein